jgi:hypothetical protein
VLLVAVPAQAAPVLGTTSTVHGVGGTSQVSPEVSGTQLDISVIDPTNNDDPCAIASDGTYLWVANDSGGSSGNGFVSQIDITTGRVKSINSSLFNDPVAIAANGTTVWVLNTLASGSIPSITQINVASGLANELDTPTINYATAIAATPTALWILDREDGPNGSGALFELDIASGSINEIDSPSFDYPSSLAVTDNYVWVTNSQGGPAANGSVSEVNIATSAVTEIDSPIFNTPSAIAADDDLVSVVNQGTVGNAPTFVTNIDPVTNDVTKMSNSKLDDANDVALSISDIWVTTASGTVVEVNRLTGVYRLVTNPLMISPTSSPNAIVASGNQAWTVESGLSSGSAGWIDDINNDGPVSRYGIGLLPPENPSRNVTSANQPPPNCLLSPNSELFKTTEACTSSTLALINAAHAKEHVLPMVLPRNWSRLTVQEQLFVIADLERVDRGLPPYLGLNALLSKSAETAAKKEGDPGLATGFPVAIGFFAVGAGGTWAGNQSVLFASYGWMYSDGWGGPHDTDNIDCTSPTSNVCWGHRDELLGSDLASHSDVGLECTTCEMGTGYAAIKNSWGSFTDLIELPSGTPPAMTFTWTANVLPYLPKQ